MKKKLLSFILLLAIHPCLFAQDVLPILKTNSDVISIKDGDELRTDYWTLTPETKPDIYFADKISEAKKVTFFSDIDSISFELKPREKYDFIILLNGKDSCFTQLSSGITFQKSDTPIITHDTIPFILTSANNISIQTILNKVDTLNLMFHTANSSVSLTQKATENLMSLSNYESDTVRSWGGESSARYCKGNSIQIGNFNWEDLTIWEGKHSGPMTDGKFGPNLFNDKILEINFDENIIIIHSELPEIDPAYEKLNLIFRRSFMFLEAISTIENQAHKNQFLIHSGFGGALLFDDEFVQKNELGKQLEIISESSLRDSYGNVLKTKKAILPALSIGAMNFSDVPIGFFEGAIGRQKMSVIGGNLLKRFNIIFDLQQAHVYLKENGLTKMPYGDS